MTYFQKHPVRLVGGRLALDFANTADWTATNEIAHEKIADLPDLRIWADAAGLLECPLPEEIADAQALRSTVRSMFVGRPLQAGKLYRMALELPFTAPKIPHQPLLAIIALSASAIVVERREAERVKMCPGNDCGWLFIDETRNARRRWCSMDTCGNRAKAARHYALSKGDRGA